MTVPQSLPRSRRLCYNLNEKKKSKEQKICSCLQIQTNSVSKKLKNLKRKESDLENCVFTNGQLVLLEIIWWLLANLTNRWNCRLLLFLAVRSILFWDFRCLLSFWRDSITQDVQTFILNFGFRPFLETFFNGICFGPIGNSTYTIDVIPKLFLKILCYCVSDFFENWIREFVTIKFRVENSGTSETENFVELTFFREIVLLSIMYIVHTQQQFWIFVLL